MVNNKQLNIIFHSLADPTRRDIVGRVARQELSVGQLASVYDISLPAISKHVRVLEQSHLIIKRKEGRNYFISLNIQTMHQVDVYLERYRRMWEERFNKLEALLRKDDI